MISRPRRRSFTRDEDTIARFSSRAKGMTARSVTEGRMDAIQVHKGYAVPPTLNGSTRSSLAINPAA